MFFYLLLIFLLKIIITANAQEENKFFAITYTSPRFSTSSELFKLSDGDFIYDTGLSLANNSNNSTILRSLQIGSGCKLLSCSDPKLEGNCTEFSESQNETAGDCSPKSLGCKCSSSVSNIRKPNSTCATLYSEWFYSGDSYDITFSGSTIKFGKKDQVGSIMVNEGCKVDIWAETSSSSVEENVSYLFPKQGKDQNETRYSYACCHCSEESSKVCNEAKEAATATASGASGDTDSSTNNYRKDYSEFVKNGRKIFGIGRNYRWKKSELTSVLQIPEKPIVFLKPSTSYIVEGEKIQLPKSLGTIFYEIELGVVIGKGGKYIPPESALDHVAGYFLALDMTAKEFLKSKGQNLPWEVGKGFDTAAPVSHFIPKHLIPNPDNVELECRLNGNTTQLDNTSNMIFNVSQLISYISTYMTLEPFDTILTGTPDGLGPVHAGDVLEGILGKNITNIKFEVVDIDH